MVFWAWTAKSFLFRLVSSLRIGRLMSSYLYNSGVLDTGILNLLVCYFVDINNDR
jgi:hypothetical protein